MGEFFDGAWARVQSIDGNWVDCMSLIVAVGYAAYRHRAANIGPSVANVPKRKFISKKTAGEVANATSLFPLFMLSVSAFDTRILTALISSNKLILAVAGVVALLSILDDD